MKILIFITLLLLSTNAKADCFCACIDGEVKSICTGIYEVPLPCQKGVCYKYGSGLTN
jgi:hypothetical protein